MGQKFAKTLISNLDKYKTRAAETLLSLYNDTWLDEEIGKLTESQFIELLVDPGVVIYDEIGAACIYFNDSDMFAGHFIEVSINKFEINGIGILG
jgi:hypothetical protein